MNILLNIPETVVEKYQKEAELDKRSRKNLMEKVLIDYFENPKPTKSKEPEKQFQEKYPPEKPQFKNSLEERLWNIEQEQKLKNKK